MERAKHSSFCFVPQHLSATLKQQRQQQQEEQNNDNGSKRHPTAQHKRGAIMTS